MRTFDFSTEILHICMTLTATQHAHWPYRVLLSKRQALSTSRFLDYLEGAMCGSKRDLLMSTSIRARRRQFSEIFRHFSTHGAWSKTLSPPKICAHPMDRAEVLHTASYDIELSWKNTTSDFKLVLRYEILTFRSEKYI